MQKFNLKIMHPNYQCRLLRCFASLEGWVWGGGDRSLSRDGVYFHCPTCVTIPQPPAADYPPGRELIE